MASDYVYYVNGIPFLISGGTSGYGDYVEGGPLLGEGDGPGPTTGTATMTMPLFTISGAGDAGLEGAIGMTMPLFEIEAEGFALDYTPGEVSSVVSLALTRIPPAATHVSSVKSLVLTKLAPAPTRVSSVCSIVLNRPPPRGGGQVPPRPDFPLGVLPRSPKRFVRVRLVDGTRYAFADNTWRDRDLWYAGFKPADLYYVSPIELEFSREGYRGKRCTIRLVDYLNRWKGITNAGPVEGSYWEVFLIDDEARFAEQDPYQIYGGFCVKHTNPEGFMFEVECLDPLGRFLAEEEQPMVPPHLLTKDQFAGLLDSFDGKSSPLAFGRLRNSGRGIVPGIVMGEVNLSTPPFAGVNVNTYAVLFSELAMTKITDLSYNIPTWGDEIEVWQGDIYRPTQNNLSGKIYRASVGGPGLLTGTSEPTWPTGVGATVVDGAITWTVYDTDTDRRFIVPNEAYGVQVICPWKPGWGPGTGLTTNWVDYGTPPRRYGAVAFIDKTHRFAKAIFEGRMQLFMEGYGINENEDASGRYFDHPEQIAAFLISSFLTQETDGIDYGGLPMLDGTHGIIDMDSVDRARAKAIAMFPPDGAIAAMVVGREGSQQQTFQQVNELLVGGFLEIGTDRFGRLVFDRHQEDEAATVVFTEFFHHIRFWSGQNPDDFKNWVDNFYGRQYAPPVGSNPTPPEGEPLPRKNFPDVKMWEVYKPIHDDTSISYIGRTKRFKLENFVVRESAIAEQIAVAYKRMFVGPDNSKDGPRDFKITAPLVDCLGRTLDDVFYEIKLGTILDVTDREGEGSSGYENKRCRVRKIVLNTEDWTGELHGRVLQDLAPEA